MRILHTVESYPPSTGGMQEVVRQISEHLAFMGHEVTVATSSMPRRIGNTAAGVKIEEFAVTGNEVRGIRGETDRYRRFLRESRFDVMTNFAAQQWATDLAFPLLDVIPSKNILVPTGFSGLLRKEYHGYFERMKSWMRKYDMNVFLSHSYRDIRFAREHGVEKITVIPNGASEYEFMEGSPAGIRSRLEIPDDHFLILHVGSHTSLKGHAETIEIFRRARLKKATLLLIGNPSGVWCTLSCRFREQLLNTSPWQSGENKMILVTSLPRTDTVAAYMTADLFLFPSNIECSPLVLFECMASRTPFLSTDVGNAAEIADWSQSGLILPTRRDSKGYSKADIAGSVKVLENLYRDEQLRISMAESGFQAWRERFTWGRIAGDYENLYKKLVGN
jgi:glycosyltransferase involved in cell wall biosynthesis